ncbi:hypothetical protein ACPOL_1837 [Acidisarcina polymorpha]|uniref:Uncharacterized protein n=1 Tax=Acidisarcina polymorpha TaxID=2211140 RepID=A0A2Z5FWC6_9BACT|nr:hypothetical protein ACPOL_1837 [Acidisarcina polymorpha]
MAFERSERYLPSCEVISNSIPTTRMLVAIAASAATSLERPRGAAMDEYQSKILVAFGMVTA